MYVGMRIETTQSLSSIGPAGRQRPAVSGGVSAGTDSVSLQSASAARVHGIQGDTYDPRPIDIARALVERAFER